MKTLTTLLAASVLLVASVTISSAQILGPLTTITPISSTVTDWNSTLSFAQFNPSLGVLESVTLSLSSTLTTTLTVTNQSHSSPSSGYAVTELVVNVQDPGNNLNPDTLDIVSPHFNYSSLPVGNSVTSGLLTKSQNDGGNIYTSSAILSEFTGLGDFSLNAGTVTTTGVFFSGGNAAATQTSDASLTGTVTYDYAAIPEPSSLSFGLLLLAGSAVLIRRGFLNTRRSL